MTIEDIFAGESKMWSSGKSTGEKYKIYEIRSCFCKEPGAKLFLG